MYWQYWLVMSVFDENKDAHLQPWRLVVLLVQAASELE